MTAIGTTLVGRLLGDAHLRLAGSVRASLCTSCARAAVTAVAVTATELDGGADAVPAVLVADTTQRTLVSASPATVV